MERIVRDGEMFKIFFFKSQLGSPLLMVWMFVSLQNSCVENIMPKVMAFGDEAFGKWFQVIQVKHL